MDPYLVELEVERRMWLEDARRSREEARADARFHFRLRLVLLGVSLVSVAVALFVLLR